MRVSVPLTRAVNTPSSVSMTKSSTLTFVSPAENRIPPLWSMVPATVSLSTRPPVIGKVKVRPSAS
jgi:hypothetical protein